MDILDAISKMGEIEDRLCAPRSGGDEPRLTESEFITPIFFNNQVATRIAGVVYPFSIPKVKPGWYKMRPVDYKSAEVVEEASFMEIEQYLEKLPKVRVILIFKKDNIFHGVPFKTNAHGLPLDAIPIYLHDDMPTDFDQVVCRFDGLRLWYERVDPNNDPSKGEYLRESVEKLRSPKLLRKSGLILEERIAYNLRYALDKELLVTRKERDLKNHVEHAGGQMKKFVGRKDHYQITYEVDGHTYTSSVSKDPVHRVISAGVCLSGYDADYDLKSLITVMRERDGRRY